MNLKKSFAMCLSMLISLAPASLRAMKEYPDETDKLLSTSSNDSKPNEKDDVQCIICLGNKCEKLVQVPCGHKFHEECINQWKEYKNTCPLCRKNFGGVANQNIVTHNTFSELYWRERFNNLGIVDIHDFPEMQGKNDNEIIEFLVKPLRDGTYDDLCFTFQADSQFGRQIFYYHNGSGRNPQDGITLMLQTPEGLKPAGIASWDFAWRVWDAAFDIRQRHIGNAAFDIRHRHNSHATLCHIAKKLSVVLGAVGLGLLACHYFT